jgi:hypothetical protein
MPEGTAPRPPRYLVEWYRPGLTGELLEQTASTIDRCTADLSAGGTRIDLLLTLFVPADEVAFCLFAAGSPTLVEQACQRARLPFTRIAETIDRPAPDYRSCDKGTRDQAAALPTSASTDGLIFEEGSR